MSGFGDDSVVVPDVVEPIRAYRAWSCDNDGVLRGFGGTEWPTDGPLEAGCYGTSDSWARMSFITIGGSAVMDGGAKPCVQCPSPSKGSHSGYGCGIYGYKTPTDLAANGGAKVVWGEVLLWGTVYEHDHGWRAELAQVAAIYRLPCSHWSGKAAKRYGVDLLPSPFTQADIDRARAPKVDLTKRSRSTQPSIWSADLTTAQSWFAPDPMWTTTLVGSPPLKPKGKKKKGKRRG